MCCAAVPVTGKGVAAIDSNSVPDWLPKSLGLVSNIHGSIIVYSEGPIRYALAVVPMAWMMIVET